MQGHIPGSGAKKPLNMLQQPIYPDIKAALPDFKSAGKYWTVDVGQTMLDKEDHTQTYEHAILAQSRDHGRDRYGHTSYQEKIAVFRPPLQNFYEDHGPLNRLPTKIHAIQPRLNPGTSHGGQGTSAYSSNNATITNIDRHISDRISSNSWRSTFFAPMDMPQDNSVLPDLETTLPSYSVSSGYNPDLRLDAPNARENYKSEVEKIPQISASSGYTMNYQIPTSKQTSTEVELRPTGPETSASAGYNAPYTMDGETRVDYDLQQSAPSVVASAGYNAPYTMNGETRVDYDLQQSAPSVVASAGYSAPYTMDGETHLDEMSFNSQIDVPTVVSNPGSETGYQTRLDSYTTPEQHLKIRENPRVSIAAHRTYNYQDRNSEKQNFHFKQSLQPVKSYGTNLNGGVIKTLGVESYPVKLKYDSLRNGKPKFGVPSVLNYKNR